MRVRLQQAAIAAGLAVAIGSVPVSAQVVGRVVMASGEAVAVRDGREVPLSRGAGIQSRDVLQTGPRTSLQVRFTDESIMSIREQSRLQIEDFQYAGKPDGQERAFFRLVKGAFRTVTGLIGQVDHSKYRVSTSAVTIGIRGTMYALAVCEKDCLNPDGSPAPDGVYGTVIGPSRGTNQITLRNDAVDTAIGQGRHFHVAGPNGAVNFLLEAPRFLETSLPGGAPSTFAQIGSQRELAAGGGMLADGRPNPIPVPVEQVSQMSSDMRAVGASQFLQGNGLPVGVQTQAVTFAPIGGSGIVHGQLAWTTSADMDLYLVVPGGNTVAYFNPTAILPGATVALDVDNTSGGTPSAPAVENIRVQGTPPAGNYTFSVNNYSGPATASTLRVTGDGNQTGRTYSVPTLSSGQTSDNYVVNRSASGVATYSVVPRTGGSAPQ